MNKILITGASGFIGRNLFKDRYFNNSTGVLRRESLEIKKNIKFDFEKDKNYSNLTRNFDCIIHLAGIAHVTNKKLENKNRLLNVNYYATKKLALAAAKSGVKKFIFLSSIKVLGDYTRRNQKFNCNDPYCPMDIYAFSKMKAEIALINISRKTNMQVIIIRSPLVYDKDAKGNIQRLVKLIKSGFPLPLASIKNYRSIVSINNLISFLKICAQHKKNLNTILHVSDRKDLSTIDLMTKLSRDYCLNLKLFKFPIFFLKLILLIIGKKETIHKVIYSLRVDQSKSKILLNWKPK